MIFGTEMWRGARRALQLLHEEVSPLSHNLTRSDCWRPHPLSISNNIHLIVLCEVSDTKRASGEESKNRFHNCSCKKNKTIMDSKNTLTTPSRPPTKHKRRFCKVEGCERIVKSQGLCQVSPTPQIVWRYARTTPILTYISFF